MENGNNVASIIKKMGEANNILRECQNELLLACGFGDGISYDGDYISKERVESWSQVLGDIDKVCFFV